MSKQENQELQSLVNINEDACKFYRSAAQKAKNPALKTTFTRLEGLHRDVTTHLQSRLRANGERAVPKDTVVGQVNQIWATLMTTVSNDVDETLVEHLEEAEDRCLQSMSDAIENRDIMPETRSVLEKELVTLRRSHDYMRDLKEHMLAA